MCAMIASDPAGTKLHGRDLPLARLSAQGWVGFALCALIGGLALAIRLTGLDTASLSHPEIYAPGLPLAPGISAPPPRFGLAETVWWHFHDEPHPMGWYLAMMAWVRMTGVEEWWLRLPSALIGAASVCLTFALGNRLAGRTVATIAAVLLALHGLHVFWSQIARMYVPGAFLALLATYILVALVEGRGRRPWLEAGYVATAFAGTQTVEFFWVILALHILWVALTVPISGSPFVRRGYRPARLLQVQALALILSAPELAHAVYRARGGAADGPSLRFLQEYFSFGLLFAGDKDALPQLFLPMPVLSGLAVAALVLAGVGFVFLARRGLEPAASGSVPPPLPATLMIAFTLLSSAFTLWLASIAHSRGVYLAVLAVGPWLILTVPRLAHIGQRIARAVPGLAGVWAANVALLTLLGVAGPLVVMALSFKVALISDRAFLIFVPYYLIAIAAGLVALSSWRVVGAVLTVAIVALFAASLVFSQGRVNSPIDYKGIAEKMRPLMLPGDVVFVRNQSWVDTPLFYYLAGSHLVAENYGAVAADPGVRRIWVLNWPGRVKDPVPDPKRVALAGYERGQTVSARRVSAELYRRLP